MEKREDVPLNPVNGEKVAAPGVAAIPQGVPNLTMSAPPVENTSPSAVPPSSSSDASINEKHEQPKKGFFGRKKAKKEKPEPKEESHPPVKFSDLFRYATKFELTLNAFGLLFAIMAGATTPLMTLICECC